MNPASYGHGVKDADSSLSYSSSENWYKKRAKYSKSSNRSSGRGNSAQCEPIDENFIKDILHKNEDVENHSSNIAHSSDFLELLSNKRIEQSISKFSSHLHLPAGVEEVPEPDNIIDLEEVPKKGIGNPHPTRTLSKANFDLEDDEEFVEEIIEDVDENKLSAKGKSSLKFTTLDDEEDDVVDEVGDVEIPTMGETGHKFNEIILSDDDDYDSVVIDQNANIEAKAAIFEHKMNKFTSSYDYKSKDTLSSTKTKLL